MWTINSPELQLIAGAARGRSASCRKRTNPPGELKACDGVNEEELRRKGLSHKRRRRSCTSSGPGEGARR